MLDSTFDKVASAENQHVIQNLKKRRFHLWKLIFVINYKSSNCY